MRCLVLAMVISLSGCGDHDAARAADLAQAVVDDLAALVAAPDLATPVVVLDLMPLPCTQPMPGVYVEAMQYDYTPANGGVTMPGNTSTTVVVRNNGTYSRPSSAFTSPTLFHCSFSGANPLTCLAQCCPGQASSPEIYTDGGGWVMWMGGSCAFQTSSGGQYVANVFGLSGAFSR